MKSPALVALAALGLYLLTRQNAASAAPGGALNTRAQSTTPLTSPQTDAPEGFMYAFDYDRGAWALVRIQ